MRISDYIRTYTVENGSLITSLTGDSWGVVGVHMTAFGSGYTGDSVTITATDPAGVTGGATIEGIVTDGEIRHARVTDPGSYEQTSGALSSSYYYVIARVGSGTFSAANEQGQIFLGPGTTPTYGTGYVAALPSLSVGGAGSGATAVAIMGPTSLDAIPTLDLQEGKMVAVYTSSTTLSVWRLVAGTDAEDGTTIIRPGDYADLSTKLVWKLQTTSTAVPANLSITSLTTSGNVTVGGTVIMGNSGAVRLPDADGSNYIELKAEDTVSTNTIYKIPEDGSAAQVLATDGSGNLYWKTDASSANSLANTNQTLTGNRTVTLSGSTLSITGSSNSLSFTSSGDMSHSGTAGFATTTATSSTIGTANVTTLNVSGTTTAAAINGTNISASGTLGVTGTSTLAAVSATNITASGTLGVTGTSTLAAVNATNISASGTLSVTGTSTMAVINGTNISASGTLSVSGTSTLASTGISGTLSVSGSTTLAATSVTTLSASGTASLAGVTASSITVSGNASIGGTVELNGVTYSFPGSDGTNTQVLSTDGAGNLSWEDMASLSDTSLANTNQSLTANRTITLNTRSLTVSGSGGSWVWDAAGDLTTSTRNLAVGGSSTLQGLTATTFSASGAATFNGTADFNSSVTMDGGVTVATGALAVSSTINATGTTNISNAQVTNLTVSGSTSTQSILATTISTSGNVTVGGTINLGGVTYTFPGSAGTNGYVLTTNGSGTLSWTAAASDTNLGNTNLTLSSNRTITQSGRSLAISGSGGTWTWDSTGDLTTASRNIAVGGTATLQGTSVTTLTATGTATMAAVNATSLSATGNLVVGGTASFNGVAYTWPGSAGTNGYVLSTNGSGTLSWIAAGSGGGIGSANQTLTGTRTLTLAGNDLTIIGSSANWEFNSSGVAVFTGTAGTWNWQTDGTVNLDDSAIYLANSSKLNFSSGWDNSSAENGDLWLQSTNDCLSFHHDSTTRIIPQVLFVGVGGSAITAAGPTSVVNGVHTVTRGSLTIPAGTFAVSKVLRVRHTAILLFDPDQTLSLIIKFGSNTIGQFNTAANVDGMGTKQNVIFDIDIACATSGSNYVARAFGQMTYHDSATGDGKAFAMNDGASTSLAVSTAQAFDMTWTFGQTGNETYTPISTTIEIL